MGKERGRSDKKMTHHVSGKRVRTSFRRYEKEPPHWPALKREGGEKKERSIAKLERNENAERGTIITG